MQPVNADKYSHCGPFQHSDIFRNSLQFMGYGDLFLCAQVCHSWNKFSENPFIWKQFFIKEKIPFVEKGEKSNLKEEFRILYPRTISGCMGERLFGNFRGELPYISREIFEKFYKRDPFDSKKSMMDTFKIVVFPSIIERTSCAEFPYILDENAKLQLVEPDKWTGETLLIPNTIPNRKILCENPLSGQKNTPVFAPFPNEVLDQCNTDPDKISLYFMRIHVVGRTMSYPKKKTFVEDHGFEVTSLEKRSYFNEVSILRSGTCPDAGWGAMHVLLLLFFLKEILVNLRLGASSFVPARKSGSSAATGSTSGSPWVALRKFSGNWDLDHWNLAKVIDFLVPLGGISCPQKIGEVDLLGCATGRAHTPNFYAILRRADLSCFIPHPIGVF